MQEEWEQLYLQNLEILSHLVTELWKHVLPFGCGSHLDHRTEIPHDLTPEVG